MEVKLICLSFVKFLFLFAILTLVYIYREFIDRFYVQQVPKIEKIVYNFVGALYQYEDKISLFIIRSMLLGTDVDYSNLMRIIRQLCLRLFFYIQISRLLSFGFGTIRRFWPFTSRPKLPVTNQASQKQANPPNQTSSTPTCKCHLFPNEFHWLLFDNDQPSCVRAPNESHQKIIKLFDIAKNQSRPPYQEHRKGLHANDEFDKTFLDDALDNEYTGWSKEILGRSTPGNRQNMETQTAATSTPNVNNSHQGVQNGNCEHCGWSRAIQGVHLPESDPRGEPGPSARETSGREDRQPPQPPPSAASLEMPNPMMVILRVAEESRPEQANLEETAESAPWGSGPAEEGVGVGVGVGVGMSTHDSVPRCASTPMLCSLCPRPERRFATTSAAELMPLCFKFVAPFERWPRTTYTLVNVKPAVD